MVPFFWQARFEIIGVDGAATSVLWSIGIDAFPSCLVVIATTTILYSVKGSINRMRHRELKKLVLWSLSIVASYSIFSACNNERQHRSAFRSRGRFSASQDEFGSAMCNRFGTWDLVHLASRVRAMRSWCLLMWHRELSHFLVKMELDWVGRKRDMKSMKFNWKN